MDSCWMSEIPETKCVEVNEGDLIPMAKKISYLKLKKLLLDKKMTGQDLRRVSGISTATLAKINRDDNITTAVLLKICNGLKCELDDIMELVEDDSVKE